MKSFFLFTAKWLGIISFLLAISLTAYAELQHQYVPDGIFMYDLIYDSEDPYTGTATLMYRNPDNITESIQYDEWDTDSILMLPSMIGGFPLTCISGGFQGCDDIKTIIVPSKVNKIERGAFWNSSLESIYFACDDEFYRTKVPIAFEDSNDHFCLKNGTFEACKRLKTVEFRRPVNKFPSFMFMDCPQLENIYFNFDYINSNDCTLDTIGECAFFNCVSLSHFEIPKSVKVISDGAFAHCHNLETINMPSDITTIGNYAFAECHQLDCINLGPSLQFIGEAAFLNCHTLTSMSIPDSITMVRNNTFYDCRNLTNLELNNVTTIGERAFAGCNKLTELDLSNVRNIGEAAFFGGSVVCTVHNIISNNNFHDLHIGYREEHRANNGSLKKINLGGNISLLYDRTFVGHVPDTITCLSPAPPIFSTPDNYNWTFSLEAYDTTVLRVPRVLVNDYREAHTWSKFINIEGMTIMGNGDVNGDSQLGISDVTALIDVLLSGQTGAANPINADVNGDGNLSIADVTKLIDVLLSGN